MKKRIAMTLLTGALVISSFANAAEAVKDTNGLVRKGTVSVSGATTLSNLESMIKQEADKQHASRYKIIAAGGHNLLSGTAIIYQ